MQRFFKMWLVIGLMAAVLAGCETTPAPVKVSGAAGTEPVPMLRQSSGSDAEFAKVGGFLLNAAGDTKANLGDLKPNYETESVIVIALGELPTAGYSVAITGVQKQGDKLFVQFTTTAPAAGGAAAQVLTYPFAAVAIPKATGTLHLEASN